jgi:uncharacterized membrane protein
MDAFESVDQDTSKATSYRALHLVNAVLFAGLWLFVLVGYQYLPDQVPQHMGLSGEVNRWANRGMWFFVPILMSTQLVILYGIAVSITNAQGINVPHKKRLLALPRAAQAYALQPMRGFLFGTGTWMLFLTWGIKIEFFIAAQRGRGSAAVLPLIATLTVALMAGLWWKSRQVARRIDAVEQVLPQRTAPQE